MKVFMHRWWLGLLREIKTSVLPTCIISAPYFVQPCNWREIGIFHYTHCIYRYQHTHLPDYNTYLVAGSLTKVSSLWAEAGKTSSCEVLTWNFRWLSSHCDSQGPKVSLVHKIWWVVVQMATWKVHSLTHVKSLICKIPLSNKTWRTHPTNLLPYKNTNSPQILDNKIIYFLQVSS